MYKQASKLGLRFLTPKGSLSSEQLWSLTQTDLATSIKGLKKEIKKDDDDDLSFLVATTEKDALQQLRFDILKDVYLTKKQDSEAIRTAKETKEHNAKIAELIASKKDKALENLSVEELEKMFK